VSLVNSPISLDDLDLATVTKGASEEDCLSAMDDDDLIFLKRVRDSAKDGVVKVYRGARVRHNERGLSWTTDKERAEWFAKRFNKKHVLLSASVPTDKIITAFTGRKESEVVLRPSYVKRMKLTKL